MKNIKFIALISIMICILIAIPNVFAVDDADINGTLTSVDEDVLSDDCYFDVNSDTDGNGSADSPYNNFTTERIPDNSVVHFASGEYNLSDDGMYYNVSFYGNSAQDTVLNGNGHELYVYTQFTLKNITLKNIKIYLETLTASNTVFKECGNEYSNGGVIYADSIILYNCSFYNNHADNGGAIYMKDGGKIEMYNTTFENNSANYGGAIYSNNAIVDIYNSTFTNNSAKQGGAVYSKRSVNVCNSSFINNYANYGGAIFIMESNLESNATTFNNNKALYYGGAVFSVNSYFDLTNSSFFNNHADLEGGAVYSMRDTFNISKSNFINNSAAVGGALFVDKDVNSSISNNFFDNNVANFTGGAIYSLASVNSTIADNTYKTGSDDVAVTVIPYIFATSDDYDLYVYNSSFTGELPSYYSLKDEGYVTPVKNQHSGQTCWAFAAYAALESCILKASGQTFDFSEENMKNLISLYSDYGWNIDPNTGGYDDMAIGYLTSWLGPVFESDDEYDPSEVFSPILNSIFHVQNVVYLTRSSYTDNDAIKKALMDYGGVATSMAWHSKYLDNSKKNYYCTEAQADVDKINHAVTIVGWDDNYSKSNFKGNAPGDGAWIIKNSWGTSSGDNGFYYVSYYDVKFAKPNKADTTYTFILNDTVKFDKNYQYDLPGKTDFFVNSSSTVWYKNVFNSTGNEYLAAVSTFFSKDTNWTLSINVNGNLKLTQSGFSKEGYYTINLNEFIPLNAGDIFEVIFKISVDGEADFPISEKVSLNNYFYSENVSFLSYDGVNWTDMFNLTWKYSTHHYKSQVACIKAFTVFDLINTTTSLTVINNTDTVVLQANVLNQYNRPVNVGNVTFSIDGRDYVAKVNNGIARAEIFVNPGNYTVSAVFNAVGHISSSDDGSCGVSSVSTNIHLDVLNEYNSIVIIANVTTQENNPLNMSNVIFTVDGKNITVNLVDGIAKLTYSFKNLGFYEISAKFNEIYYYYSSNASSNVTVKSTIISKDATKTYNSVYSVSLLDNYGNPLKNTNVTFTIKSKTYKVLTDKNGVAKLTITLSPGTYSVKITNPTNKESKTQTIKVVKRITENKGLTMYYGAGKSYKVKVFDDNGKIAKNVKVTFKINNKKYVRTTDSKGYAYLKISLTPKSYTVTAEYKGFKVSNKVTVKSTIVTKDIKVKKGKTIKFTAKLLDKNGKILKNKKVTFKFKGKTFKIKTNKKGIATLKITKKYKIGKYTIKTTYGKLTVKNTIKITK